VILATATSAEAMNSVQAGFATNGTLMLIGVTEAIEVSPMLLIPGRRYAGTSIDSEETLAFTAAVDERGLPARTGRRSASTHGEQQGAVPR
jgi:hypothetical protein